MYLYESFWPHLQSVGWGGEGYSGKGPHPSRERGRATQNAGDVGPNAGTDATATAVAVLWVKGKC